MSDPTVELHPNKIVQFLDKLPEDFTKADLTKFIEHHDIRIVNYLLIITN